MKSAFSLCVVLALLGLARFADAQQPDPAAKALATFEAAKDGPEPQRGNATRALARFGTPAVTNALLAALAGAADEPFRVVLLDAISGASRPQAVEPLAALLLAGETTPTVRNAAARALAKQGEPGIDRLQAVARASGTDAATNMARSYAMIGLSQANDDAAWRALAAIATDGQLNERRSAVRYLDRAPDLPEVTSARLAGAKERDVGIAVTCARQLAQQKHPAARDLVLELARRDDAQLAGIYRADLVQAVATVFDPAFFEPFLVLAGGGADENSRKAVDAALTTVAKNADFVAWLRKTVTPKRDAGQRVVAIRVLGEVPGADITTELLTHVRAREPEVVTAALRALGRRGDRAAVPELRKLLRVKGDERRIEVLQCLHALLKTEPTWGDELFAMLRAADRKSEAGFRTMLLDLLADTGNRNALETVWADFESRDWAVRAAAYDFCRSVRDKASVPRLIDRVEAETGRLREDVLDTLQSLTAMRFATEKRWREWWKDSEAGFELVPVGATERKKPSEGAGATVTYYGIPLVSERVVFVVDVSGSMSAKVGTDQARSRLDEAKRQLHRVVEGTPKHFKFNIVSFHTTIATVFDAMSPAADKLRATALAAIDGLAPTGGTNVHGAMERAFAEPEVDTIYLLSDGSPSAGAIQDPDALADEIARWNRVRQIRIHCIAIGTDSPMLKRIAKESGGSYALNR